MQRIPPDPLPRFIKLELLPSSTSAEPPSHDALQLLKSFMLQSVHLDVSLNEFASHGALTFVFKVQHLAPTSMINNNPLTFVRKNPLASPCEMLFAFPLMDGGAAITGVTTSWADQTITGRVRGSAEGKAEYTPPPLTSTAAFRLHHSLRYRAALSNGHTASLTEHADNDLFLWRVGGIPAGATVTVVSKFVGPVVMSKRFGKKPQTVITLTLPAVVPPWYGRAHGGDAALAYATATQAPSSVGGLEVALPPFTATVRSHFVTQILHNITVTSPTHGPPSPSSIISLPTGLQVSFHNLFKAPATSSAATNLQLRWQADGIVPNMSCVGRIVAGAGMLYDATCATADAEVSKDAAAAAAMEQAAAALADGTSCMPTHS